MGLLWSLGFTNSVAPKVLAISDLSGLMSTAMILEAPAALHPMTAASPTAPKPNTAHVEPDSTWGRQWQKYNTCYKLVGCCFYFMYCLIWQEKSDINTTFACVHCCSISCRHSTAQQTDFVQWSIWVNLGDIVLWHNSIFRERADTNKLVNLLILAGDPAGAICKKTLLICLPRK